MQQIKKSKNQKMLDRINFLLQEPEERFFKKQNLTFENEKNILSLKNRYRGKRCFIAGSSPSLNELDLSKLNNEFVFTVNRGYMLKEKGLLHTNFHIISDKYTFKDENTKAELLNNFTDNLFCYAGMEKPPIDIKVFYFDYILGALNKEAVFQTDLLKPLIAHQSVIHFAIQIAYYLGFSEIYLLGVDLDFAAAKGHAYVETNGEKQRQIEHSIKMAKTMLDGIKIFADYLRTTDTALYNASPKGIVDCIKRVKYENLF